MPSNAGRRSSPRVRSVNPSRRADSTPDARPRFATLLADKAYSSAAFRQASCEIGKSPLPHW